MGYKDMGRTEKAHWQDDVTSRSQVYHVNGQADINRFAIDQGWFD
jgi:hypothetical protein